MKKTILALVLGLLAAPLPAAEAAPPAVRSELRKLFEAAGVKLGEPVVTYCNSGRQASMTYFALKYLGYEPSLYDGSMSEWGLDPAAPVEK